MNKQPRPRRQHSFFGGILTKIIIILVLITILFFGGYSLITKKFTPVTETNIAVVMNQLSFCQELVTAKYRYSDIISIRKTKALAKSLSIIKYSGIIRIGIADITHSDFDISNDGKTLKIRIPDVEILGNEITSQEVFDETSSIFVPITLDEVFTEIDKAKDKTLEELVNDGVIEEARENAKKVIQQIMMAAGFEEVIVV